MLKQSSEQQRSVSRERMENTAPASHLCPAQRLSRSASSQNAYLLLRAPSVSAVLERPCRLRSKKLLGSRLSPRPAPGGQRGGRARAAPRNRSSAGGRTPATGSSGAARILAGLRRARDARRDAQRPQQGNALGPATLPGR
ncbi:uncharacterized protein LOC143267431 [Peromyscus maniculatus bairdii]|uniref:uncharacterized protein LOC143267431 n=1 Tax=Peromyscus maniculatus bairdii TaxID=230844 RepID=UPI003FD01786